MLFERLGCSDPLPTALLSVVSVMCWQQGKRTVQFYFFWGGDHIHMLLIQYSVRNIPFVTVDDPLLCLADEFNFIIGMQIED